MKETVPKQLARYWRAHPERHRTARRLPGACRSLDRARRPGPGRRQEARPRCGLPVRDGLLLRNPADSATPPSAREAKAPEMQPWTAGQLAAFLRWAEGNSQNAALWTVLAMTGMRRGEALSLRWRDIDFDAATVCVRRSAGIVRIAGQAAEMIEDDTKSSKPRVVDLDPDTTALLRAWRQKAGLAALQLARPDALVFGDIEGAHRNGEHVWRQFKRDIERCRKELGADALPVITVHDLRHTHATLLQRRGVASVATFRPWREDNCARDLEPCSQTAACGAW